MSRYSLVWENFPFVIFSAPLARFAAARAARVSPHDYAINLPRELNGPTSSLIEPLILFLS